MKLNMSKRNILLIIVAILLVALFALSFGYYVSGPGNPAITEATIGSEVSEKLIFTAGNELNIYATIENFAEGDGSLSSVTNSTATLIAGSETGSATDTYNVYFDISKNTFEYTVDNTVAELLIKIIDPNGNEVTSIEGFEYKTIVDASTGETLTGFDITRTRGLIKISEDYSISTNSSTDGTTQNWSAEITFVNLSTNQMKNEGKVLEAEYILTKDKLVINKMITGLAFNNNLKDSGYRDSVTKIVLGKEILSDYETALTKFDLSEAKNESIVGYIEEVGEEIILHIQSDRLIMANSSQFGTFRDFTKVKTLEFNEWYDTSNVDSMQSMFANLTELTSLDLSSFDTSNVVLMLSLFENMSNLTELNISSFNTSNVTYTSFMFQGVKKLTELDLTNFDTSNVVSTMSMFNDMHNLKILNVSSFDTSKVTNMGSMFKSTRSLESLNLSNFNTSNVTSMDSMFFNNISLTELNLSSFDMSNVTSKSSMFYNVPLVGNQYAKTQVDADALNTDTSLTSNATFVPTE